MQRSRGGRLTSFQLCFPNPPGQVDVAVPRVHWNLSTKRVLVMEWIDGVKARHLRPLASVSPERLLASAPAAPKASCTRKTRNGTPPALRAR